MSKQLINEGDSMTTDLVKTAKAELAAYQEPVGTGGEYDSSDFAIHYVRLIQASSEEVKDSVCKPGVFFSTDGEQTEFIDFVPIHIQFTRDFYDADAGKAICGSHDRKTGNPRDLPTFKAQGIDLADGETLLCASCPFFESTGKVSCRKTYLLTCYDLTKEAPFMYRVRGSAMGVFKNRIVGAVAMGRSVPWARSFQMTSTKKSSGGNSWFSPELQPTEIFSEERCAEWKAYASGIAAPQGDFDATLPFE